MVHLEFYILEEEKKSYKINVAVGPTLAGTTRSYQEGIGRVHYFSLLSTGSDYFELAYDLDQASWRICRVWLEG